MFLIHEFQFSRSPALLPFDCCEVITRSGLQLRDQPSRSGKHLVPDRDQAAVLQLLQLMQAWISLKSREKHLSTLGWRRLCQDTEESKQQQEARLLQAELKTCSTTSNLQRGKELHVKAIEAGVESCKYVSTALINMYAKCRSMEHARQVFDSLGHPDVVCWNTLILGYADNGESVTSLALYSRMKSLGCTPDPFTFVAALKACIRLSDQDVSRRAECLEWGKQIHMDSSIHSDSYVQSSLIELYMKCGSAVEARRVFDGMKHPNVVAWTVLILGYAENGDGSTALNLFSKMKSQGCTPNSITFVAALKACTSAAVDEDGRAECLERGRQIHTEIGCHLNVYVRSILIDMYAKCCSMEDARQVFEGMKNPDVVAWNALILGYARNGEAVTALDLFARMTLRGCASDCITFVAALKACALLGAYETGRRIHAEMSIGTERYPILVTCLVDFYAKCSSMVEAHKVFDSYSGTRNLTTWNALLAGYSRLGDKNAVFGLFERMLDAGVRPDGVTSLCFLTCCSHAGLVEKATAFLETMSGTYGVSRNVGHYNCVVDVLGRCNKLDDALALLRRMACKPDFVTWMTVLAGCRKWKNVGIGRLAFRSLVDLDDRNPTAYVLMGHIYGSRGMWKEQEMVLRRASQPKAERA